MLTRLLTSLVLRRNSSAVMHSPCAECLRIRYALTATTQVAPVSLARRHYAAQQSQTPAVPVKLTYHYHTGSLVLKHREMARMVDSSATGQFNDTNVLVTVVNKPRSGPPASFLPLTIICNLLAYSGHDNPDVLCINATSFALYGSSVAWNGPIGCVRIGLSANGKKFIVNPTRPELEKSALNLVLSVGPNKNIVMIEGWSDNLSDERFTEAMSFGTEEAFKLVKVIQKLQFDERVKTSDATAAKTNGASAAVAIAKEDASAKLEDVFQKHAYAKLYEVFTNYSLDKKARDDAITTIRNAFVTRVNESMGDAKAALTATGAAATSVESTEESSSAMTFGLISEQYYKYVKTMIRDLALDENKRVDGRDLDHVRPISCSTGMYDALHGSALFQRGQTQVLCSVTFDSPEAMYKSNIIHNMMSPSLTNFDKNFMLHYEFPAFATNEIAKVGGRADRREIGHGALAEKAVYPLMPDNFDFTVRALCEVLESNGSSSMASVCAASLALMDAGVEIKESVAGVAMGIMTRQSINASGQSRIDDYKILTDISGFEDYYGDMDFKIAGTQTGITSVQADFKIDGLPMELISKVLKKSLRARQFILKIMSKELAKPRTSKKNNQPVLKTISVTPAQRSKFAGVGGINLKKIASKTGVTLSAIDETSFRLFAPNNSALAEAEEMINQLINQPKEPELDFGGIYTARIVEVVEAGLMVQFYSTMKPTLLPNSQLEGRKIVHGSVSEYKVGQDIKVKYFGRDPISGHMRISRKALFMTSSPARDLLDTVDTTSSITNGNKSDTSTVQKLR